MSRGNGTMFYFDLAQMNAGDGVYQLAELPPVLPRPRNRRDTGRCSCCGNVVLDLEQDDLIVLICERCAIVWPTYAPAEELSIIKAVRACMPLDTVIDMPLTPNLIAAYQAQYREEHRDEIAAKKAQYYAEHRDEIAAKKAQYREEHRDEIAAKKAQYREEHRDEIAAKQDVEVAA